LSFLAFGLITLFAMSSVTIDVVAARPDGSICLYLVEQGPWPEDHSEKLRALQKRLFDVVEVVAQDKLVERFPEIKGRGICIRLDCYDLPGPPVDALFVAFQEFCKTSPEWSGACRSIVFEISHGSLREANQQGGADGRQPLSSEGDSTSAAAASRRSP
jgi:hypothetical protein